MTEDRRYFVDTNVLLAASDQSREKHVEAVKFLESGLSGERRLFTNGQVFREYLVVATRPLENNGFGLNPKDALMNIEAFGTCIQLIGEGQAVAQQLQRLVKKYNLKGKRIHDANLVATMRENGLKSLKTFNQDDFAIFEGIELA